MTDKEAVFRAKIHCYPDHDFDVALKSDKPDTYCWRVTEDFIEASRFDTSPATAPCPTCGNFVEVKIVTEDSDES